MHAPPFFFGVHAPPFKKPRGPPKKDADGDKMQWNCNQGRWNRDRAKKVKRAWQHLRRIAPLVGKWKMFLLDLYVTTLDKTYIPGGAGFKRTKSHFNDLCVTTAEAMMSDEERNEIESLNRIQGVCRGIIILLGS